MPANTSSEGLRKNVKCCKLVDFLQKHKLCSNLSSSSVRCVFYFDYTRKCSTDYISEEIPADQSPSPAHFKCYRTGKKKKWGDLRSSLLNNFFFHPCPQWALEAFLVRGVELHIGEKVFGMQKEGSGSFLIGSILN